MKMKPVKKKEKMEQNFTGANICQMKGTMKYYFTHRGDKLWIKRKNEL